MSKKMKRRDFMRNSAVAGLAIAAAKPEVGGFPMILKQSAVKPLVISSANGNKFKNGGPVTAVQKAFTMITEGADVLDSVIAGVNIVELDPLDDSVGYGGLPNAEGIVQLDSSCMHGPKKRAGAVGAIEGVRTPSLVAKAVLENTDHHLIVGKGAQDFARGMGFKIEDDLNTDNSRRQWLEWKRQSIRSTTSIRKSARKPATKRRWRCLRKVYCGRRTCTVRSIVTESIPKVKSVASRQPAVSPGDPGRLGDSPTLVPAFTLTAQWVQLDQRAAAKPISTILCSFVIIEEMRRGHTQRCRHGSAESNQKQHGRKTAAE